MSLADVTSTALLAAVDEFDQLGRDDFLAAYGFGKSRKFFLFHNDSLYDSKAIVGAAHQHATGNPLPASAFSGGEQTVVPRLTALGFDVRDVSVQPALVDGAGIGDVLGTEIGTTYSSRREVASAGVHRALQAGIVGTAKTGAESIVVSGGYEDDEDNGDVIVYTGHGGRDSSGRQIADQTFEVPGNAALLTSHLTGAPVRVVRGAHAGSTHAPGDGYRYDGAYRVERVWRERGRSGHLICRFTMIALSRATSVADGEQQAGVTASEPNGVIEPERRATTVQRIVRSVQVAEYVKALHDHNCQVCGTRLQIGARGYSEAAHIRALGRPHAGPDVPGNLLCLCPNCHVLFDNGVIVVLDDLTVEIGGVASGALRTHASHYLDVQHLRYQRARRL